MPTYAANDEAGEPKSARACAIGWRSSALQFADFSLGLSRVKVKHTPSGMFRTRNIPGRAAWVLLRLHGLRAGHAARHGTWRRVDECRWITAGCACDRREPNGSGPAEAGRCWVGYATGELPLAHPWMVLAAPGCPFCSGARKSRLTPPSHFERGSSVWLGLTEAKVIFGGRGGGRW
jgi:hypothetical protein